MKSNINKLIFALIIAASGIALYFGWKLFWFLTDDSLIAFRYVSNSIFGHGYVWNPPPFRPVEGYTSFLWVIIMDFIWRLFDTEPPQIANTISLIFSYLTLVVVVIAVMQMRMNEKIKSFRLLFLFLVLLGIIANPTFLTWTSSGLETALFDFFVISWVITGLYGRDYKTGWLFGLTLLAALLCLTRPDGLLYMLATLLLIAGRFRIWINEKNLRLSRLLSISPIIIPIVHQIWRLSFYGEWLPNTYYAKNVAPWPAAGVRYFASFFLEYSLWIWIVVLGVVTYLGLRKRLRSSSTNTELPAISIRKFLRDPDTVLYGRVARIIIIATIILHVIYYTLIIGGDHFEWRVYSHLIPLIFLSFLWMINKLDLRLSLTSGIIVLFVLLSFPIPWTLWSLTKDLNTRDETYYLIAPVSQSFPKPCRLYTGAFDSMQEWLIRHSICMRRQEHKIFYKFQSEYYPPRSIGKELKSEYYPVYAHALVGMPGWVFPHVNIIDLHGLNDYIIARHHIRNEKERQMAHDRWPPEGYVESFKPNITIHEHGKFAYMPRNYELTREMIVALEKYWEDRIIRGVDILENFTDQGNHTSQSNNSDSLH